MSKRHILIVDDDQLGRHLLVRALVQYGFDAVDCETAREALQLIEASPPALLVSDYEMPEITGAQLCELIRQNDRPEIAELPVILLTAHAGEENEVECLNAGANDFVSKPVNVAILRARIETHLRLHDLRMQLQQQNAELERWRSAHELDMEAAQITQRAILPSQAPQISGWDVAAHFQPVIQVGGDIYDWIRIPSHGWLFWIADMTGHGASAALLTALCKLDFRHAVSEHTTPGAIMQAVNAGFYSILRGKSFMTAACMVVHPDSGKITFAGAGHPPLLIVRRSGAVESIASQSPPVGIISQQPSGETDAHLEPGDIALLYTDGLYSITDPEGAHMTHMQAPGLLPRNARSARDFLDDTVNEVLRRVPDGLLPDDLAAIALRRAE